MTVTAQAPSPKPQSPAFDVAKVRAHFTIP